MKFKIKEFRTADDFYDNVEDRTSEFCETKEAKVCDNQEHMCRVCWLDGADDSNPLISACKCTGSVEFLHVDCLKKWLHSKMTTKSVENHHTLTWKKFECDLC